MATRTKTAPSIDLPAKEDIFSPGPASAPVAPQVKGRTAVTLPDLPKETEIHVLNQTTQHWHITSKDKDIDDLALSPLAEQRLPNSSFWLSNLSFRALLEDVTDDDVVQRKAPLAVYNKVANGKNPRPVPPGQRCDPKYLADVAQITTGELNDDEDEGVRALIGLQPMRGDNVDLRYLINDWYKVLTHSLFVLKDNRRIGKEVDQRRIDLIEARIKEIDEVRREHGVALL